MRGTLLVCIAVAGTALLGCDATPQPPAHTHTWLSYKYNRACTDCGDLFDATPTFNYYTAIGIDLNQNPPFGLDDWLNANGFNGAVQDVRAVFGNRGDLAFGRDMHCMQSPQTQNVACYVSNYGPAPRDGCDTPPDPYGGGCTGSWVGLSYSASEPYTFGDGDATYTFPFLENLGAINDAINAHNTFGTVAMVWTPNPVVPASANNVKFYAFDGGGGLIERVGLDEEDTKTLPRMCMACHGGKYDTNTDTVTGASFLPFDLYSFKYSNDFQYDFYSQQEAFRQLNQMVLVTNPPAQAIKDFINGSYPNGVGNVGTFQFDKYLPPGWTPDPDLYNIVVKPYCRTCHLAAGGNADFGSYQKFVAEAQGIQETVCDLHDMPHAEVPYVRFWLKDMPAQQKLRDFLKSQGQTGCP
jgi:hypothetical protein